MNNERTKAELDDEFRNIKYILTSNMRTKLLLAMYNGSKNLEDLRLEITKPSATILHGLKELENINLISKEQKYYKLTSSGYLLTTNMVKLIENWYSLEKHKDFWNNHDLNDIPEELLKKLYLLKDVEHITSTTSDLSNVFNTYIRIISQAEKLKIVLPIYSENHFKHIIKLLNKNKLRKLELILNESILRTIKRNHYYKKSLLENSKVDITVLKRPLKIFLTYSKNFMSITLFFKDGHYDDSQILIGQDENSILWAKTAFEKIKGGEK